MRYPRLKDLREDHELMQKQVAAALGIDQRVYSNYETGKREIPVHHLAALADLYHTSTDYLLGRDGGRFDDPVERELAGYLEDMRAHPEKRMLFSVTKGATKEQIEAIVHMIEELRSSK